MAFDFNIYNFNNSSYGNYGSYTDADRPTALNNNSALAIYGDNGLLKDDPRYQLNTTDTDEAKNGNSDEEKKPGYKSSPEECETCKNRKYQDGSDEANVSFKNASHISPEAAGAAVRAHENEHVQNAYKKAAEENAEVVSASVAIHTAVCPECGRTYVSGGVTHTMIRYSDESNPYQQQQKTLDEAQYAGANVDAVL